MEGEQPREHKRKRETNLEELNRINNKESTYDNTEKLNYVSNEELN